MSGRQTSWFGAALILGLGALASLPFRNATPSLTSHGARFQGTVAEEIVWQERAPELQMPARASAEDSSELLLNKPPTVRETPVATPIPSISRVGTVPSIEEEYGGLLRRFSPSSSELVQPVPSVTQAVKEAPAPASTRAASVAPSPAITTKTNETKLPVTATPKPLKDEPVGDLKTSEAEQLAVSDEPLVLEPLPVSTPVPRVDAPRITEAPQIAMNHAVRSPQRDQPRARARTHRIKDGDTLAALALRYLGDAARAPEIFEANRRLLTNPDLLPIGKKLTIPNASPTAEPPPGTGPSLRRLPAVNTTPVSDELVPL